jgi:hypothetical protein
MKFLLFSIPPVSIHTADPETILRAYYFIPCSLDLVHFILNSNIHRGTLLIQTSLQCLVSINPTQWGGGEEALAAGSGQEVCALPPSGPTPG